MSIEVLKSESGEGGFCRKARASNMFGLMWKCPEGSMKYVPGEGLRSQGGRGLCGLR